jgi:hypothetical protein
MIWAVGVHVRGRDVVFRADVGAQGKGEPAGDALQFGHGVFHRVDLDAALGAAVGQVGHGALPGHPRGQGPDFVDVHRGMVAEPALVRAQDAVVLHPVAGKHLHLAVVHFHGKIHDYLVRGVGEDLADVGVQFHDVRRLVELQLDAFEQADFPGHGGLR